MRIIPFQLIFLPLHSINKTIIDRLWPKSSPISHPTATVGATSLIRTIEHSVEHLTLAELEALYYDLVSKDYIR